MSNRDWRNYPYIGVVIFAVAGLSAIHYCNYHGEKASGAIKEEDIEHHAGSATGAQIPPPIGGSDRERGRREPSHNDSDSHQPHWSNYIDLLAQWAMAIGTGLIVIFTWSGLRVLKATLREAEIASGEARKSADAANSTVNIAREANEITRSADVANRRPLMSVVLKLTVSKFFETGLGDDLMVRVAIVVKNHGRVPALDVVSSAECVFSHRTSAKEALEALVVRTKNALEKNAPNVRTEIVFPEEQKPILENLHIALGLPDLGGNSESSQPMLIVVTAYRNPENARILAAGSVYDLVRGGMEQARAFNFSNLEEVSTQSPVLLRGGLDHFE